MSTKTDTKELTPKQQAFLDALFSSEAKGQVRKAMTLAGYSELTRPTEVLQGLAEEIAKRAKLFLAENSGQAVWALMDSLNDPSAAGTTNKLKAIESILNRAGVKETDNGKELTVPASGLVILPAKSIRADRTPL